MSALSEEGYRIPFYCQHGYMSSEFRYQHIKNCEHCTYNVALFRLQNNRLPLWLQEYKEKTNDY
jgi:hypothetical protein